MASAFLTAAQAASPSALDEWVSGERDSPACVDLLELAAAVSPASLRALIQELPTVGGASWLEGADVVRFLGLTVALLASEDAEVSCAAATAFLVALRCLGNGTPGLFHPLALHELCKSLPAGMCSGDAVPVPRKKGRRKQQQDSDDDEEMEDVGGAPPPAKAADGLAKELCLFLEAVPLVCYPETLSQLVAALVEAAARGAGSRVYLPLTCCLGSEHGELASTARTVLRSLKPSLTLTRETSPNQSATEAQAACVDFLIRLCTHNADDARAHDEPRTKALQHVVQTLLQHAAVGAPDKAEARALVCNAVCAVLAVLPTEEAVRYAGFLLRYSRTSKVGARVLSVEMASTVLLAAAASSSSRRTSLTADGVPQILWKLLVQRISDKAPGVRTKSLGCVAVLLVKLHAEPGHRLLLQVQMPVPVPVPAAAAAVSPMMPPPPGAMMPPAVLDASSGGGPVGSPLAESRSSSSGAQVEAASSLPTIGALLQQRCVDERPAVRRAALQAIEAWARASGMQVSGSQLKLISRGCSDVSPAIRKQAARSLWAMLQLEPQSAELQAAWTSAILPLASDTEQTVCDACLDTVLEGVLKPLARSKKPRDLAGWPLLLQLPESAMPYLCRAVRLLARQKRLPGGLAPKLQALLAEPPQPDGAAAAGGRPVVWSLLAEMAKLPLADLTQQKLDHAAVLRCWELASGGEAAGQPEDAASALQLLAGLSGRSLLATELGLTLRGQLVERLQRFDASPQLAVLLVQACSSLASPAAREPWAAALLKQCDARLAAGGAALADDQRELRVCAIAVGEVALVAPRAVTPSLVASLQELAHGGGGGAAPASRAAAFVALGKVCMGSVEVAQRLLPVFMTALTSHEDAAVRSNALVILFDLAKRHTALLERHFSTMALALYDAAASVRHSALLLFSQLLLEDYVKWRPTLFRAFCVALADVEPAVRASAQVCLFELLLPRSPLLAFNSFAGLLFQINGCTQHAQHSATLATAESAALEGLRGEGLSAQRRRLLIFRPLLGCMSGEQKLQTMAKLSQDVLGAVPEGQFTLEDIQFVLSDSLVLLACKEIKLSPAGGEGAAGAADDADEGGAPNASAAAAAASAHGKLLSQVARKATVEAIVPVVVELKRFLESNHSPLLRDLFLFLRELLRDHKQYLQDILSRDKQLAAEIEYDMKQLDATRNRALQSMSPAARQSGVARSPALGTPRGTTPGGIPGSKGKATAMRVPTSDQLHALSIPRLRKQRVSGSGLALSVMRAPPGTPRSAGASVSVNPPSAFRRRSEGATPAATVRPDVVMASPR